MLHSDIQAADELIQTGDLYKALRCLKKLVRQDAFVPDKNPPKITTQGVGRRLIHDVPKSLCAISVAAILDVDQVSLRGICL